jgi:transcription initiation factor TFIIH subunit 1
LPALQEHLRAKQAMARADPTVNLAADAGDHFSSGFSSLRDGNSDPTAGRRRTALNSIAQDINRHAAVVLEGAPEGLADLGSGGGGGGQEQQQQQPQGTAHIAAALATQQKTTAAARAARATAGGGDADPDSVSPERLQEWQQRAASALEDLTLDERDKSYAPLNIQDPRAYYDSSAAAAAEADAAAAAGGGEGKKAAAGAAKGGAAGDAAGGLLPPLAAIQPLALPNPPCDPAMATAVLLELSQDQDAELVAKFGAVAASALRYPPQHRSRGLPPLLLVSPRGGLRAVACMCPDSTQRSNCTQLLSLACTRGSSECALPLPPVPLQEHLRGEALKTNELLRHFWPCMPPLSAHRVELAAKLAAALQKQHAHLTAFMRQDQGAAAGWI